MFTPGTAGRVDSGKGFDERRAVETLMGDGLGRFGGVQETAAQIELSSAVAVGEKAVVADTLEAAGQNVHQETPDEFTGVEGHGFIGAAFVVFVGEGDFSVFHTDETVIGDGDAVGITGKVIQDGPGTGERRPDMDVPLDLTADAQEFLKLPGIGIGLQVSVKFELAHLEGALQSLKEKAPEEPGENPDGQEELLFACDPAFPVRSQSSAGHDAVQMGMVRKRLAPGVQHRHESQLRAEVLGVGCDTQQRLRGGAEQHVIDRLLVLQREGSELVREGKHGVAVRDGQYFSQAFFAP